MEREKEGFPITSLREINTLLKAQHPNIVTVRVGVLCCAQADRPRNTLYNVHVPKKKLLHMCTCLVAVCQPALQC